MELVAGQCYHNPAAASSVLKEERSLEHERSLEVETVGIQITVCSRCLLKSYGYVSVNCDVLK